MALRGTEQEHGGDVGQLFQCGIQIAVYLQPVWLRGKQLARSPEQTQIPDRIERRYVADTEIFLHMRNFAHADQR